MRRFSQTYLLVALGYWAVVVALYKATMDSSSQLSTAFIATAATTFNAPNMGLIAFFGLVSLVLTRTRAFSETVVPVVYILVAQVPFFAACHTFKLLVPQPAGFWADIPLARFDAWLHGGQSAWDAYAAAFGRFIPDDLVVMSYFSLWGAIAYVFPACIVAFERDPKVAIRYVWLCGLTWVILGNVIAIAAASAGPVYFFNVTGQDDFRFLSGFLGENDDIFGGLMALQDRLWLQHQDGDLGTGVSAFPSLHVAASMLPFLYAVEKLGKWAVPFAVFPFIIQYGSVRTGFHYAVDGYFSILVVVAIHIWLKRRADRKPAGTDLLSPMS